MNLIIKDVNHATSKDLNLVYALLLYKGHGKLKTSDRSYRTISTCSLLAKALDCYIHDLYIDSWSQQQAPTQYQGRGSSHELAALLLTEVIAASKKSKSPVYLLFLDAKSAFDKVVKQHLVRQLYFSGVEGDALRYFDNRLECRPTVLDWNSTLMGPINDQLGLEQGGITSTELYKIYNNPLLKSLQKSKQGVSLNKDLNVASVGQADDIVLC